MQASIVNEERPLEVFDLASRSKQLRALHIAVDTKPEDAMDALQAFTECNGCTLGIVRFVGRTPWERHEEDEFLHVLQGDIEVTILDDDGVTRGHACAGQVLVVPAQRWHRQHAPEGGTVLFMTGPGGSVSELEDPRGT